MSAARELFRPVFPVLRPAYKRVRRYFFLRYFAVPLEPMPFDKVFVIGQYKTGTTSMHVFFLEHGLRHMSINRLLRNRHWYGKWGLIDRTIEHFHSFDDAPWNYPDTIERLMKMDRDFRFILTLRDPDSWFDSYVRFFGERGKWTPDEEDRESFIEERYHGHNKWCRDLAEAHDKPLLEVDISDDDAPRRIREFLELPPSDIPMPHTNRTA